MWNDERSRRELVTLDVIKATAMIIVIALQASEAQGLLPGQRGALHAFEMMSSLFFQIQGVKMACSACFMLDSSWPQRRVLGHQVWRALLVLGVSLLLHVLTQQACDLVVGRFIPTFLPLRTVLEIVMSMRKVRIESVTAIIAVPISSSAGTPPSHTRSR